MAEEENNNFLDGADHAALFTGRERRLSFLDFKKGLNRNIFHNPGDVIAAASFVDRTLPLTAICRVEITGAAPAGTPLSIGTTNLLAIGIAGAVITFSAGGVGATQAQAQITLDGIAAGMKLTLAIAAFPGDNRVQGWVIETGHFARAQAATPFPLGEWADSGAGLYNDVMTDLSLLSKLDIFDRQLPRHFRK
jgi:hypothetical protein